MLTYIPIPYLHLHSLTHSLAQSLTHFLMYSLTNNSVTRSLTHLGIHLFTYSLTPRVTSLYLPVIYLLTLHYLTLQVSFFWFVIATTTCFYNYILCTFLWCWKIFNNEIFWKVRNFSAWVIPLTCRRIPLFGRFFAPEIFSNWRIKNPYCR